AAIRKCAQRVVAFVFASGDRQFRLTVDVRERHRKDAGGQAIQFQVESQAVQFAPAGLEGPNQSFRADAAGGGGRLNDLVSPDVEQGHARLQYTVEESELVGLKTAGDIDLPAHVVAQEEAEAGVVVPPYDDRGVAFAFVKVLPKPTAKLIAQVRI